MTDSDYPFLLPWLLSAFLLRSSPFFFIFIFFTDIDTGVPRSQVSFPLTFFFHFLRVKWWFPKQNHHLSTEQSLKSNVLFPWSPSFFSFLSPPSPSVLRFDVDLCLLLFFRTWKASYDGHAHSTTGNSFFFFFFFFVCLFIFVTVMLFHANTEWELL